MDSYQTILGVAEAGQVISKSSFIALAAGVHSEQAALSRLEQVRAAHPKARHTAYAYVLRQDSRSRHSDDGEPPKTAGLPILGVIEGMGLTDCIVTVTRYFGGVLLGTGGLVRAYGGTAKLALDSAQVRTVRACAPFSLSVAYPLYEPVRKLLEQAGARLEEPVFTDAVLLSGLLPAEETEPVRKGITELSKGGLDFTPQDIIYDIL